MQLAEFFFCRLFQRMLLFEYLKYYRFLTSADDQNVKKLQGK